MRYGFRTYRAMCPFCKKDNVVWDSTAYARPDGVEQEKRCDHYYLTQQGFREPDIVFRLGSNQKSGI
jgi:hypothetical protein